MKRIYRKLIKQISSCLMILLLAASVPLAVRAEGAKVVSTVVYEDSVYTYIKGVSDIQSGSTVQVGNVVCDAGNISTAAVVDLEVPMRTIILIDNSKSIPSASHAEIQEILTGLLENKIKGEQVRIGTFSDKLTYLCDFTDDEGLLKELAGEFTYNNQDTYLSDVLYSLITDLKKENTYVYTRILIISDGADDQAIGYTNDEVRSLIEKSPYPVYTVGVPGKNNSSELETMFSFSRAADSDYFLLDGSVSTEDMVSAFTKDQDNRCIKVTLTEGLKDGSNKNILLKLVTSEGDLELVTSADMPFGSGVVEEPQPESNPEPKKKEEPEEKEEKELPVISTAPVEEKKDVSPVLIGGVIVGILLLVAVVVLIIWQKKGKKKEKFQSKEEKKPEPAELPEEEQEDDGTIYISRNKARDTAENLWDKPKVNRYVVLTNLDKDGIILKAPIKHSVSIGRGKTDIAIPDDKQVSHEHCEIILRGGLLYIRDTDSKNGTIYENVYINEETPIVSGGKVGIGRYTYRVSLIEES